MHKILNRKIQSLISIADKNNYYSHTEKIRMRRIMRRTTETIIAKMNFFFSAFL